jgi:hypothetical protein
LRTGFLAGLLVLVLAAVVGVKVASNHLGRDRWIRPRSELAGTQFQFVPVGFYVFNETGHAIRVRVSAGGKLLFEQRVSAERPPSSTSVHQIGGYKGAFPWAVANVAHFDSLTRFLEVAETEYLRVSKTIDLEAIPNDGSQGSFSIRVTGKGFEVTYASFPK